MGLTDAAPVPLRVNVARPTWGQALRFSWSWQRSELAETRRARVRPGTVLMLEAAVALALVAFLSNSSAPWWILAIAAIIGAGLGLAVALGIDARGYRHSCWHDYHSAVGRRGGAFVRILDGRPAVQCVHAMPRGTGLGSDLMAEICAWADRTGQNLQLKASCDDALRFYRRHGFTVTHGRHMTRTCQLH